MRRRWYTDLVLLPKTVARTAGALRAQRLGVLVPLLLTLVTLALILTAINAIAPLAPFVYSLF